MSLNGVDLTSTLATKFLGIWIQENMKWTTQIMKLSSKLNKSSYLIRILSGCTSLKVRKATYFGYFHSIMQYGIIFWGNSTESITLFRIQKRTIRAMVRSDMLDSCKPIFKKLNIMPLPCVYIYRILLFVRTEMRSSTSFLTNQQVHNHNTRQRNDLHVNYVNTSLCKSGVLYSGIELFNKLPVRIKSINSMKLFKKELKSLLLKNTYYSVLEYLTHATKDFG